MLLLAGAAEAARGWRPSRQQLALIAVVLAGISVANVGALRDGARALRGITRGCSAAR